MSVYRSKKTTNMRSGLRKRAALQPIVAVLNEWKDLSRVTIGDERSELALDKTFHLCCSENPDRQNQKRPPTLKVIRLTQQFSLSKALQTRIARKFFLVMEPGFSNLLFSNNDTKLLVSFAIQARRLLS